MIWLTLSRLLPVRLSERKGSHGESGVAVVRAVQAINWLCVEIEEREKEN